MSKNIKASNIEEDKHNFLKKIYMIFFTISTNHIHFEEGQKSFIIPIQLFLQNFEQFFCF